MGNGYGGGGRNYGWNDQPRAGGREGGGDEAQRRRDRNPYRGDDRRSFYSFDQDRIGRGGDHEHRRWRGDGGETRWNEGAQDYGAAPDRDRPPGGYQWERDERGRGQDRPPGAGGQYDPPVGMMSGFPESRLYGSEYGRDDHRRWWDKTTDEVQSWFGHDDDARRRRADEGGSYRGRGPEGYRRSDERIREDVHDKLTDDCLLDASRIAVAVEKGEVTLSGSVVHRRDKRRAEDLVDVLSGVRHVQNNIRVHGRDGGQGSTQTPGQTDPDKTAAARASRQST